ncbi:MAG: exosome complex RNA-binding protein Rrp4 [Candidatus Woesearchaeota archaeon]
MTQLHIKDKDVCVPGELLATGMDYIPGMGAYRKEDKIYANRVGLVSINGRALKLIPLCGPYMPKRDDVVIGKVTEVTPNGWRIDTNCSISGLLNVRDASNTFVSRSTNLTKILDMGDYVCARIFNIMGTKTIDLSLRGQGLHKLKDGMILRYSPNKFPRIIGRAGSMVSMIKHATKCQIFVGQNGLIWISGEPDMEYVAKQAFEMIEQKAHTSGLTDRVKAFLQEQCPEWDGQVGSAPQDEQKQEDGD